MFPHSKSKQQLLSNLEKLKKFKPLIKQSIDTFEKPRKSLKQKRFKIPEKANQRSIDSDLEQDVITEEGTSNYNTKNSFDDFMEIEKNIRKSIQIENLKGLVGEKKEKKREKKTPLVVDEEKYVGKERGVNGKTRLSSWP